MTAEHRSSPTNAATGFLPVGVPVVIGSCAGWYHPGRTNRGIVLVGAQGFEAFCAYQSWRAFAGLLSDQGMHVLRFDFPGEGDSLGGPEDGGHVAAMLASVKEAVRWIGNVPGVTELGLAGLRLGGLLALHALGDEPVSSRIVLLAPPVSGRAYIRELKASARMIAGEKPGSGVFPYGVNLCGHFLSDACCEAIAALDYHDIGKCPDRQLLVASPEAETGDTVLGKLGDHFGHSETAPFEGYAEMMVGPTRSLTPWTLLEKAAQWLSTGASVTETRPIPATPSLSDVSFREDRVIFGPNDSLVGVLCQPVGPLVEGAPVIFPNSGANNHAGWARMHVEMARRLAADGIASLRYDATGIGDSACSLTGPRPLLYSERHKDDLKTAITLLEARGHANPVIVGACAAAFLGFHAIATDERVRHVIAVNMLRMLWHANDDLDTAENGIQQTSGSYASKVLSASAWKRLVTGEVRPSKALRITGILVCRALQSARRAINAKFGKSAAISADSAIIHEMLRNISQRHRHLDFVYSRSDSGRAEFSRQLGSENALTAQYTGIRVSILDEADHELTSRASQDALLDLTLAASRQARAK